MFELAFSSLLLAGDCIACLENRTKKTNSPKLSKSHEVKNDSLTKLTTKDIIKKRKQVIAEYRRYQALKSNILKLGFESKSIYKNYYFKSDSMQLSRVLKLMGITIDSFKKESVRYRLKYDCMRAKTKFYLIDVLNNGKKLVPNNQYKIYITKNARNARPPIALAMLYYIGFSKVTGISTCYIPKVRLGDIITALDSRKYYTIADKKNALGMCSLEVYKVGHITLLIRPINPTDNIGFDTVVVHGVLIRQFQCLAAGISNLKSNQSMVLKSLISFITTLSFQKKNLNHSVCQAQWKYLIYPKNLKDLRCI